MTESPRDATTGGMKGAGFYDVHSEYQRRVIEAGEDMIRAAATSLETGDGETITIVDYGSGTGATSVRAVGTAIAALRDAEAARPIQVIHNDVPGSDFTQLFRNVAGEDGYLRRGPDATFAMAAAGSFFKQVIPDASADLGMCSNAAHWLRQQPAARIPDGLYFCEATGDQREAIAEQAAGDWVAFLSARAEELKPGGHLVVQGIGSDDNGGRVSASRLLRVMWRAADELVADGVLDRDVLAGYVLPVYCRSPAESKQPIGPGGELEGELELVDESFEEVANPYWEAYERSGDPEGYATTYVEFVRAFAESNMLASLFEPGALGIDPKELCDRYFERLRAISAASPDEGRYEAWILRLLFARR